MTIEEKVNKINESKKKNYLFVSPRIIIGGAKLVYDYESLELYEQMEENTNKFAENEIVNLISEAELKNQEISKSLRLNLIFNGDFDDLPKKLNNPVDFILNNKERFIAVYQYVKETNEREFFLGFSQVERINKYSYIYLDFAKLFKIFEENNISYDIDLSNIGVNTHQATKFKLSYCPIKEKVKTK